MCPAGELNYLVNPAKLHNISFQSQDNNVEISVLLMQCSHRSYWFSQDIMEHSCGCRTLHVHQQNLTILFKAMFSSSPQEVFFRQVSLIIFSPISQCQQIYKIRNKNPKKSLLSVVH